MKKTVLNRRLAALAVAALSLLGVPAEAEVAVIPIHVDLPEGRGPLEARMESTLDPEGPSARTQTAPLAVPSQLTFKTAAGTVWRFHATAEGWWSAPALIVAKSSEEPVEIFLFPAGAVRGRLALPAGAEPLDEVEVRLSEHPDGASPRPIPPATVRCPVQEKVLTCPLPAGRLDLRISAEGYVPLYRKDVRVREGETLDLGALELLRGGSVSGRVEADPEALGAQPVRLQLEPIRAGRTRQEGDPRRTEPESLSAEAGAAGFFQLRGVPPGQYRLVATHPAAGTGSAFPVDVERDRETALPGALALHLPARIEVVALPPADWRERPWRVEVMEMNAEGTAVRAQWQGAVDESGSWKSRPFGPGRYLVAVKDADGSGWHQETLTLAGSDQRVTFVPDLVDVEGELLLGGEPVSGTVWFGGRRGATHVRVEAEHGAFRGVLPRAGDWKVDAVTEEPRIERTQKVEVSNPEDGGAAWVSVRLPTGRLEGEVVDGDGQPAAEALVFLTEKSPDIAGPRWVKSDGEGRFSFQGVPEGTHLLQALQVVREGRQSSAETPVELDEEGRSPLVRLELLAQPRIRGIVLAPAGPVAGAGVAAEVAGEGTQIFPQDRTDAAGRFALDVPAGQRDLAVTITPPGFSFTCASLGTGGGEVPVVVDPLGGTLRLRLQGGGSPDALRLLRVVLNGVPCNSNAFSRWVLAYGRLGEEIVAPRLAPGDYRICWSPQAGKGETCRQGWLRAGSDLEMAFGTGG
jgi:hypothetical protein